MTKKKYWFAAKNYGWGWNPETWQGWFIIGIYIALNVGFFILIDQQSHSISDTFYEFIQKAGILLGLLILTCFLFGEDPEWRFGKKKK